MDYDVSIFGTLRFKRNKLKAWYALNVDSRAYPVIARTFPKREHHTPIGVEQLLQALPRITGRSPFLDEDGNKVHVRARLTKTAFESRCRQLAALFLSSALVDAEGDICFIGEGVFVGYGISIFGGEGELITLTEEQVQNASMDPALDVISGYFALSELPTSPPPPPAKPRTGLLDVPPKR